MPYDLLHRTGKVHRLGQSRRRTVQSSKTTIPTKTLLRRPNPSLWPLRKVCNVFHHSPHFRNTRVPRSVFACVIACVCVHHYCVCFCGVFHPCVPSMKGCVWMLLENSQVFRCAFACVCVLWVVLWDSAITTVMWLLLDKLTLPLPS